MPSWRRMIPRSYALEKLPMMLRRWDSPELLAAVRRFGSLFLPGVPASACLASGVTSMGAGEYGGPPDYATGLFGVEWPRVEAWSSDAQTRRELGRSVPTDRPSFTRDVEGQTYLGFRSYRAHLDTCNRELPEALRGLEGPWAWRLAVASYSSGPGTVARIVRAGGEPLAAVPPAERWAALGALILAAGRAGESSWGGVPIRGRWKAAATIVRHEQRHATGGFIARDRAPEELPFYSGALPDGLSEALAELGYG